MIHGNFQCELEVAEPGFEPGTYASSVHRSPRLSYSANYRLVFEGEF
jgi:hypothetical protein